MAQVDVSTTSSASRARQTAQERIAADLREWQEKFAIAADNGSEELEKEVADIVANLRKSGAVEAGEKLVSELETVSQRELGKLRSTISQIVGSLPDDASIEDEKRAQDALLQALKASGIMIRERAHSLRKWFNEYDNELVRDVTTVVEATLEVLDHIRDLGLQEIGMRWAWMDGVTYKDWAKFHALKKQFSDWHDEVNDVGMGHEEFLRARAVGDDILSQGMNAAERTAKQLSALKEVGIWKIKAGDTSSDFDASVIDPAKIRTRTKAAIVTSPSATSTAPVSNGSTHTETSTLAIRSHVEGSQLPSQESSEILRGENPDTTPTPNGAPVPESLGSPILSGASSLGSDAIDKAQTAGKSAKSQMSSRLSSTLEAAHSKATEGVSAGSEPVSSGASSLSEHVKGSTEQTNSVAQPLSTGEVKSSPGNISARSEMLNPDRDANNIKKDKHNHADPIALADDEEISLSIVASSQFSHATSHPSDPTDIQAWDSAGDAEPVNMQEDQDIRYQLKDSTRVRATPSAVPGANLKSILSSANHELRSLVDSVSIGVRASSIDYNEANSILNEADTRLESAASAAQAALSHAVYGSSLPTNTPSESNNENSDQKLLRSAVGQLDAFSTIVDVYLQQVRSELEEEDIVSPASLPAHPTTTSNAVQDEL